MAEYLVPTVEQRKLLLKQLAAIQSTTALAVKIPAPADASASPSPEATRKPGRPRKAKIASPKTETEAALLG